MRVAFERLLDEAAARGGAVGAFTCYDLEVARAVLDAAAARDRGVILLLAPKSFAAPGGDLLAAALCAVVDRAPARACVQLDHAEDLDAIEAAFQIGVGAALADGSRRSFEDNVAFAEAAVALARRHGAHVEAELGGIAGDEDVADAVAAGALTDVEQARALVQRAAVDCLAVSIGNVHGIYREPPRLDWDRLAAVGAAVPVPLSLHGASGLPDADVRRAIAGGVRKVNVNTELRARYLDATEQALPAVRMGANVAALHDSQREAVRSAVEACLHLYDLERQP